MTMKARTNRPARWLLREPAAEASARVFCLPYSGCGATMYRAWPRFIGDIEICPVQLPGRESRLREPIPDTFGETAEALILGLTPYLDRPFALFGHCGSALIAYETAVRLARGPRQPAALVVSSQVAPHQGPYGRFLELDDEQLASEVANLMRELGGEPVPDLVALYIEVMRADLEANRRYRTPGPTPAPCPTFAVGWRDDPEVPPDLLAGWADCGADALEILDGGHFAFLQAPEALMTILARALGARVPSEASA